METERKGREEMGLLTLSRIWQFCRLLEDEGQCSRAVGSQHRMTAHNPFNGGRQNKKKKQQIHDWRKD